MCWARRCARSMPLSGRIRAGDARLVAPVLGARPDATGERRRIGRIRGAELPLLTCTSWPPSSRGKFPPKFNGMIWNTGGDLRTWGAQHWFANLSCYYEALPASGRLELMDPMFADVFRHVRRLRHRGAAAVGQPGHVHSGDHLFRRPGETAGRNRRRNAGAISVAQAVGATLGALHGVRHEQAPALQPVELDSGGRLGERKVHHHRARQRAVRRGEPYLWHHGESGVPVLAPLRIHAGPRLAARRGPTPCCAARWSFIAIIPT